MSEENKIVATEEDVESASLKKLPDLKTLREERGLTMEDIFLQTRINVAILNAIENGEFHLLPAPLYAKKFIESYAKTIGIDAETILVHYQRYLEKQAVPQEFKAVKAQIASDRKPLKRFLLYAVPAVAIIATAFIIYTFFPHGIIQHKVTVGEQKEVAPQPAPAVKEPLPEAVEKVPQIPPPAAVDNVPQTPPPAVIQKETTQIPSKAQLNLLIEATEKSWISITEDHKPPFQVTLKAGEKLSRNAREFFIVNVGNAAGVNITFQGKSLGSLGRKGQVVRLRLPQQ